MRQQSIECSLKAFETKNKGAKADVLQKQNDSRKLFNFVLWRKLKDG